MSTEQEVIEGCPAEVVYESKGCTPAGHPFMTVKRARGYYEYAERGGKDSIAFILYDANTEQFGLIYESKPPLDERTGEQTMLTTAFGGSIDMGDNISYQEICQTEVREEAGYEVPLENIRSVGQTLVSTQMSQMCEGFLVDVTDIEKTLKAEYELDPSEMQDAKDPNEFSKNKVEWFSIAQLMNNNDWKSIWIAFQTIFTGMAIQELKAEGEI